MTREDIIKRIDEHLRKSTKEYYSDFYIGIAKDVEERLFSQHQVDRELSWWIYCQADSDRTAREVERYYLDKGMQGGPGGGNFQTDYVYCYEITSDTNQ